MRFLWAIGALVLVSVGIGASGFHAPIPTLRVGSEGGEVATWQATLNYIMAQAHSRERLVVDGDFGPLTERATIHLQQSACRLRPTGIVGPHTRECWIEFEITCCGAGYPRLWWGMPTNFDLPANPYVVWWQIALDRWIERRHAPIPLLVPDGMFGPLTNQATIAFQRASHLNPHGYVGPRSWARMVRDGTTDLP